MLVAMGYDEELCDRRRLMNALQESRRAWTVL